MSIKTKLISLGWTPLEGSALDKASQIIGYDLGSDAYAQKFGRKTVFLRYTGIFKLIVPMDRDDPMRANSDTGTKVYGRWYDIETINDEARHLVHEFHKISHKEAIERHRVEE